MGSDRTKSISSCCCVAVTIVVLCIMFWIVWFVLGLVLQVSDTQRRALVDYSPDAKPLPTPTTPAPGRSTTLIIEETSSNSISKLPTTSSFLGSRGEPKRKEAKDDFVSNANATTPNASNEKNRAGSIEKASNLTGSNEELQEDEVYARRVLPPGTENRPEENVESGDRHKPADSKPDTRYDISPTKVHDVVRESSGSLEYDRPIGEARTQSRDYHDRDKTEPPRSDDIPSSRRSEPGFVYREPDFDREFPQRRVSSSNRGRPGYDDIPDGGRTRVRHDERDRGRESDNRYTKGDTKVYVDSRDSLPANEDGIKERGRNRYTEDKRERGDDDRYDDRYRSIVETSRAGATVSTRYTDKDLADKPLAIEDRYRIRNDEKHRDVRNERDRDRDDERYRDRDDERYRGRDDERYRGRDDGRYRDRDDERYRDRDDERYRDRDDERYRVRDDERYRDRDDERFKDRADDMYRNRDDERSRSRNEERYTDRDDIPYRPRDDERYNFRDEDRYKSRGEDRSYDDRDRARDADKYRSRDDDMSRDRIKENERYESNGRDRYRSDMANPRDSSPRFRDDNERYPLSVDGDKYIDTSIPRIRDTDIKQSASRSNSDLLDRERKTTSPYEYNLKISETVSDYDIPVRDNSRSRESPSRSSRPLYGHDEEKYRTRSRDDGYRTSSRNGYDRSEISPTRTIGSHDDSKYVDNPRSRTRDKDRRYDPEDTIRRTRIQDSRSYVSVTESSRQYSDDRDRYHTRLPNERTDDSKMSGRREEELGFDRRSYASEEDENKRNFGRVNEDQIRKQNEDTRRRDRNDESYSHRDLVNDEYKYSKMPDHDRDRSRIRDSYADKYDSSDEDRPLDLPVKRYDDDDEKSRLRDPDLRDTGRENWRNRGGDLKSSSSARDSERSRPRDEYVESSRRHYDDDLPLVVNSDGRRTFETPRRTESSKEHMISSSVTDTHSRKQSDMMVREKRFQSSRTGEESVQEQVPPLRPKDVIEAAVRHSDVSVQNSRKVYYPVFDPRSSNLTSPEIIRQSDWRGTTITTRRKR